MCSRNFAFNATAFRFISSGGYVFEKLRTCIGSFVFHSDGRVFIKRACLPRKYFIFTIANAYYIEESPELNQGVPTLAVLILSVD
jgi:hypothetical protein